MSVLPHFHVFLMAMIWSALRCRQANPHVVRFPLTIGKGLSFSDVRTSALAALRRGLMDGPDPVGRELKIRTAIDSVNGVSKSDHVTARRRHLQKVELGQTPWIFSMLRGPAAIMSSWSLRRWQLRMLRVPPTIRLDIRCLNGSHTWHSFVIFSWPCPLCYAHPFKNRLGTRARVSILIPKLFTSPVDPRTRGALLRCRCLDFPTRW